MKQGPVRVATAIAVVLIAGGAGFYLARHPWGGSESLGQRSDAASAEPGPAPPTSTAPNELPTISLPDVDGKSRSLTEWHGRPLLINFWATWCEPCLREIPMLQKLRARHAKDGLEVIGIAIDFRDAVSGYVKENQLEYPILIAEQDATAPKAFGVGMGLPTTVIANREGRIVTTHLGELDEAEAEKLLAPVLAAK